MPRPQKPMKILLVFAHPEPQSLNAALRDVAIEELTRQSHEVKNSDLYAMNWQSEVDWRDFRSLAPDARLKVATASGDAFHGGGLTEDVEAEQQKMLRADVLILQFPLWWFSMPAILKGGWIGSTPMASAMASANIARRAGAIATARGSWQAGGRC
jgi:NAD(P)H dehydrogenase (quinone)